MSRSYRKEALKRLQQELEATNDTKEIIRIGNAIAKLTKPKRPVGRPRQKKPVEVAPKTSPILAKWADRLSHVEPEAMRILQTVICEFEERERQQRRSTGQTFTEGERKTLIGELFGMLSSEERAVLNGRSTEVV